ncbi:MAG TPA: transaldolase [Candidatus Aquicultoraceae bacterium]|jgi:transaldolase|nr:transaldolase [Candidatus Aquicultoraceae bacterium]
MKKNPLADLSNYGQSPWLDYLEREFVDSGKLARLVSEDGIRGVTSNPTIFQKAVTGGPEYDDQIRHLAERGIEVRDAYKEIVTEDIRRAADVLRPLYDSSGGADGYVSLEVDPDLSYDTAGTVARVVELYRAVGRPNVFIKIGATREGLPAIEESISRGIPVNVTLIFSVRRYEEVARAYMRGIGRRIAAGEDPRPVASVASFFVSRIDTLVDGLLDDAAGKWKGTPRGEMARSLRGRAGIANARLAYAKFREIVSGPEWRALAGKGARIQRPLWGSTSTKDPEYSDVRYVEELIAPDTVDTMPLETLEAFRDHGKARNSIAGTEEESRKVIERLRMVDIEIEEVCATLEREGVEKFTGSYDKLLTAIDRRLRGASAA